MEGFATLHPRGHVADNVTQVLLALRIALIIKSSESLDERDTGLDHGGKLAGKENEVGLLDCPDFLLRLGGGRLLLEGKHHQPATHEAGDGIILIEGVL